MNFPQRPAKLKRHVGNPVSGNEFWPRPDIIQLLVEAIVERRESHKMFGLRRIGKSSIMKECRRLLDEKGMVTIHVNAEDFGGLDRLFTGLLEGIKDHSLKTRLTSALQNNRAIPTTVINAVLKLFKPGAAETPPDFGQNIRAYWSFLAAVIGDAIRESEKPVVLFLDELPFMLKNMLDRGADRQEVETLLACLRDWRQNDGLVMVVTGSLGLGWIMREYKLPSVHFNDLNPIVLLPLDDDEAKAMIAAIVAAENVGWWTGETTAALLRQLPAPYPIFVQVAFDKIKQARAASPEAVAQVFRDKIEPDFISNFYKQFKDRLKRYDAALQAGAHAVLATLFQAGGDQVSLDEACDAVAALAVDLDPDAVVDMLQEDGFVVADHVNQLLKVSSPLVAAWWKTYRPRQPRRPAA